MGVKKKCCPSCHQTITDKNTPWQRLGQIISFVHSDKTQLYFIESCVETIKVDINQRVQSVSKETKLSYQKLYGMQNLYPVEIYEEIFNQQHSFAASAHP